MNNTGTRIIQILSIIAFLILALTMLANWKLHRDVRDFHAEKFTFLRTELKSGMTPDQITEKLKNAAYRIEKKTARRWHVYWFNEDNIDTKQIQTERLGIPTSAELLFDANGTLLKINGVE